MCRSAVYDILTDSTSSVMHEMLINNTGYEKANQCHSVELSGFGRKKKKKKKKD